MNNNNSKIVFLVIAISVFVVLVLGVSFAYFATDMSNISVTNVNVSLANSTTMITTNSTQCEISLTETGMMQAQQNLTNEAAYSECDLEITLHGDPGIKCYYDLVLREESVANNENYVSYVPTAGLGVDYTYEFTGTINGTFSENTVNNRYENISYYNDGTDNISAIGHEIQMDVLASGLYRQNTETLSGGVIARGVIGISQENVDSVHNYHFIEKWYNITKYQETHIGKKYIFVLSAENILC